jgi:hypothetical protein
MWVLKPKAGLLDDAHHERLVSHPQIPKLFLLRSEMILGLPRCVVATAHLYSRTDLSDFPLQHIS